MQDVLSYIAIKKNEYQQHRFFTELLGNSQLSGRERMAWMPCMITFTMAYADLNRYSFRNESRTGDIDAIQRELNAHTYEEDFHWMWMLNDLELLGLNPKLTISDAIWFLWSPATHTSRRVCAELSAMVAQAQPYGVASIVESIEAISLTFFTSCQDIELEGGVQFEYYGPRHYMAELEHTLHASESNIAMVHLSEEERTEAKRLVDRVFRLFDVWNESLLQYARTYAIHSNKQYQLVIDKSKDMSREVIPDQRVMFNET